MALSPGTRLGVYEVTMQIGAGGMGEVYRATDRNLKRSVAIKVLPASVAGDADRLARFQREAEVLAALNHPNIGAIYGLEKTPDFTALVMELVEGDDLSQRIARGPIPLDEALGIARQIADALDVAHEQGIIHRDLKPANIKVRDDGTVKVLDFGLAKTMEATSGGSLDPANSPTLTSPALMTHEGVILGTAAYMSPEQARGRPHDKRTDIWSFGCVLFEMLTARRAIRMDGDSVADAIAAVLTSDPDWSLLPDSLPDEARRLLRRCLVKDPRRRLRDIGDARVEIDDALAGRPAQAAARHAGVARTIQFQRLTDAIGINESPALSPDEKMLAFVALSEGRRQIWIRLLAGGAPLQLTRDDADHEQPRWAPDSSALIYFTPSSTVGEQGMIWEIPALGGMPRPITPALTAGDLSHDGRRIALFQFANGRLDLAAVARDGSTNDYIRPIPSLVSCDCPRWSPDDRTIAFQGHVVAYFDQRIYIIAVAGGPARDVARAGILRGVSWLPDGSGIVYSSSAASLLPYPPTFNLRAVGRDGRDDRQVTFGDMSYVEPDVHPGKVAACRLRARSDIWQFPITGDLTANTGNAVRITHQAGQVQTPSVSPDGDEVVYLSDNGGHGNLWVAKTDGGGVRQITFERDPACMIGVPVWSPVAKRIAFLITRSGENQLWAVNADGSGLRHLGVQGFYACWSRDGQWLYYSPPHERPARIDKLPIQGGDAVTVRRDNAIAPAATDGSALYYASQLEPDAGAYGDWEIRAARPENGEAVVLARIAAARIPISPTLIHMFASPDGAWLAMPLVDGTTCNLWLIPTCGGDMRPVTAFGERRVLIGRRISWSPDSSSLFAAVSEMEADVILLNGMFE